MEKQKVILISLDAISNSDFEIMKKLPNFGKIIETGSYCNSVTSVYPSLTFPAHASIVTGCYPKNHGIVHNYHFEPFEEVSHWYHYASALKKKAIWDYFEEQDKKVLSLSWPVSAGGNISYSLPEMSPAKPKIWGPINFFRQLALWFNYGSKRLMLRAMLSSASFTRAWFLGEQPLLDESMIKLLTKCINSYEYNLLLFHIYGMDDAKHVYGVGSKEAEKYIGLYDELLGYLIAYVDKENENNRPVTLLVTGDHSQKNISKGVYLNSMLENLGLCKTENGKLVSWKAIFHSGDGMAYLYINEGEDGEKILSTVRDALAKISGIKAVLEKEDFPELGCNLNAALAVEAQNDYSIVGTFTQKELTEDYIGPSKYKAVHGYLPDDIDYRTLFFAYGHKIGNCKIDSMSILDIAPTICKLQNVKRDSMDGRVLEEIFAQDSML